MVTGLVSVVKYQVSLRSVAEGAAGKQEDVILAADCPVLSELAYAL